MRTTARLNSGKVIRSIRNADRYGTARLYRTLYLPHDGYAVYRHCFDGAKCAVEIGAVAHKVAIFVTRLEADHYAQYRNRLLDERGSDEISRDDLKPTADER